MKKKFMSMMLAGLLIFCLSACGETISKYKSNDADNYFMQEHTEGGTKDIGGAYLEKISFTRLLGPEKLILTVKNDDKAVKEMPFFTVDVTEDGTLISGVIYGCKLSDAQNYAQAEGNCVESYTVTESDGNIYLQIRLKENVKTSIYNNEAGKLVFSFKLFYPTAY